MRFTHIYSRLVRLDSLENFRLATINKTSDSVHIGGGLGTSLDKTVTALLFQTDGLKPHSLPGITLGGI